MTEYVIDGGRQLNGLIKIQGSKNAALPVLAAMATTDICVEILNCPCILDCLHTLKVLELCGRKVEKIGQAIRFTGDVVETDISIGEICQMRSGILFAGAVLGRCKSVRICSPGGCDIGPRPIDLHLKAFETLGAKIITEGDGIISIDGHKMTGESLWLDYPSVGATENIMLCAINLTGVTEIHNAAREPEILELQNVLNDMGFKVIGAGTSVITIHGGRCDAVDYCQYSICADRIVAGTYMTAVAIAGGNVVVKNIKPEQLASLVDVISNAGCYVEQGYDWIRVISDGELHRVRNITSSPYPGFPTDMQPQTMAMLAASKGVSVIRETVFENRFRHVDELSRMGADIMVHGDTAIINGVDRLHGAKVKATDLRSGAALIIAGLGAKGRTVVQDVGCVDRGYQDICGDLSSLGAKVFRFDE